MQRAEYEYSGNHRQERAPIGNTSIATRAECSYAKTEEDDIDACVGLVRLGSHCHQRTIEEPLRLTSQMCIRARRTSLLEHVRRHNRGKALGSRIYLCGGSALVRCRRRQINLSGRPFSMTRLYKLSPCPHNAGRTRNAEDGR
jgi:hypothetical protein